LGTRYSACPDRPWGPPSLLYNGYRVFPGSKVRPGRAALTPFYCRGHGTVALYLYPPSGPHRACNGITLPLPFFKYKLRPSANQNTSPVCVPRMAQVNSHIPLAHSHIPLAHSHIPLAHSHIPLALCIRFNLLMFNVFTN